MGKTVRDTDKIISDTNGVMVLEAQVKRGWAKYTKYGTYAALKKNETEDKILSHYNKSERTNAVNDENRVTATPSKVRELTKLTKELSPEIQAEVERKVAKIVEDAKARVLADAEKAIAAEAAKK